MIFRRASVTSDGEKLPLSSKSVPTACSRSACASEATRLWALEEGLRSPGLAAALAEVDLLTLSQSRRLQLAAKARGATAFLLRPSEALSTPSAAFTRWRVETLPSAGPAGAPGPPRWRLELVRCRGGRAGQWQVEWRAGGFHEIAHPLALAAESADRPAAPARSA